MTDDLPAGVEFVSGTSTQGTVTESDGTVSVDVGNLATEAESVEVTITVAVDPSARGNLVNAAHVAGAEDETDLTNNDDSVQTQIVPEVDLAIIKADSPDPVVAGEQLTYTLSVLNNGPSDATGVTATDVLPAGLTFRSAETTVGTVTEGGGTVTAAIGNLASGTSAVVTILVDVDPSTRDTINNTATVTGNETDMDATNDQDTEPTAVQTRVDLAVTKTDSVDPVTAGQSLSYTLTVTNDGPSDATGVVLTDTLPPEVTFTSGTSSQGALSENDGVVTVDLGDLDAGDNATATIVVDVAPTAQGTITNEAAVEAAETEFDDANNTAIETTAVDELMSSLAGSVYLDLNNNGVMEPDERGLPGITVRLLGTDFEGNPVSREMPTDEDGSYRFENLPRGTYTLIEQHPLHFIDGRETSGSLTANMDTNDQFSEIHLPGGTNATDYLFGEWALPFSKRRFLSSRN